MARTIEEIRSAAKAARDQATKVLSADETALAAEHAKRRAIDMAARVDAAELKARGTYLVQGVDLVALFPIGKAPAEEQMPAGGVIVIRNPDQAASDAFAREIEAKTKHVSRLAIDLACACIVDPDPDSPEAATARNFFERYQEAAGNVAARARELGGARAREAKRGQG